MATYLLGTKKSAGIYSYLTENPISNPYGHKTKYGTEVGVDFAMDLHTPVYALTSGPVVGVEYLDCPGGVLAVESPLVIDGKERTAALYYQHMDLFTPTVLLPNARVVAGQLIGWSGGQLDGGYHPNQPKCSGGAHIEIGVNVHQGYPWNPNHRAPHVDPTPILARLVQGYAPDLHLIITTAPGFLPIAQMLDDAQRFHPMEGGIDGAMRSTVRNLSPFIARGIFVVLGLLLVSGVLWNLLRPVAEGIGSTVEGVAKEAAQASEGGEGELAA